MKKMIIFLTLAIFIFTCIPVSASTKSDLQLAKSWARSHYSEPIKVVKYHKVPKNRKGTIYIEKLKTKSNGGHWGHIIGSKWKVRYPKKVKKNKRVTIYMVYSPKNNACDDIVAMVCLGIIK